MAVTAHSLEDDDPPVTVAEAAALTGISLRTIQRDIADRGAPVFRKGRSGPGNAALIRISEYIEWRSGSVPEHRLLDDIAGALLDMHRRELLDTFTVPSEFTGRPAHVALRIPAPLAAAYLVLTFDRLSLALTGKVPDESALPEPMRQLLLIANM